LLRAGPVGSGCAHTRLSAGARASSPTTGFAGGAAARSASPVTDPLSERVASLERDVAELRAELSALRAELGA